MPTQPISGLPEGYTLEQPQQANTPSSAPSGLPEGYTLEQPGSDGSPSSTGSMTNDVGNQVIVPKDGESFEDTMKRAAAQGKVTTQAQINKETASAPGKVAQTIAAAPLMGFAGAGALAAPSAIYDAAITHLDQLTKVVRVARSLGWSSFGIKEAHDLYKLVAGDDSKK